MIPPCCDSLNKFGHNNHNCPLLPETVSSWVPKMQVEEKDGNGEKLANTNFEQNLSIERKLDSEVASMDSMNGNAKEEENMMKSLSKDAAEIEGTWEVAQTSADKKKKRLSPKSTDIGQLNLSP